ncbi:neutral protease 2-like protein [Bimuria novae-zelandiae CBS 107.79]|uniref:Neutral protease 2 n=1 Tax=Bimuria novae-zelandiae CBS 107.79 TaxID=1447943 RepID=A0A6A5VNH4_9PLEO|nr:neutral protease 2-like protein [Bimuria novae-zelandiae CBS 107.79]
MKVLSLAALISLVNASVVSKRASPLDVKLELTVWKTGSLFGEHVTEKAQVFQGSSKVAFGGIKLRVTTDNISEEFFQVIAPGETVNTSFDVAELHDLSTGGTFDIASVGAFSTAPVDSTELTGAIEFTSNTITASVDGAAAEKVRRDFTKRSTSQSDCTSTKRTSTVNALANCRTLAQAAYNAASTNTAKVQEYFKSTPSSTISTLRTVLQRVVTECGSSTSGVSRTYCTDVYGACGSNVLAYTLPSASYIVNCPLYFSALPALTKTCHAQDQATTTLHEVTHLSQIGGTGDLGCGYAAATRLSTSSALNADSYALFANAIYAGC